MLRNLAASREKQSLLSQPFPALHPALSCTVNLFRPPIKASLTPSLSLSFFPLFLFLTALSLPPCLHQIGQGTYSNVYKARDLESGKLVALKKVRFDNLEPESVRFMAREIEVLRRLDHPNIVRLLGLVTSRMSCSLYLVFEYMEHDLAGLAACPGVVFTEAQVTGCPLPMLTSADQLSHV